MEFQSPELAPLGVAVIFITADYKRAAVEGREFAADILIKPVTGEHRAALDRRHPSAQAGSRSAKPPCLHDHLDAAFSQGMH